MNKVICPKHGELEEAINVNVWVSLNDVKYKDEYSNSETCRCYLQKKGRVKRGNIHIESYICPKCFQTAKEDDLQKNLSKEWEANYLAKLKELKP